MSNSPKKWLLIDGFNMIFRCFYGVPNFTRADGFPTNVLHGFLRSVLKLEDTLRPDAVCVFFDSGGSKERTNILSDYKAHRPKTPEDLKKQIPYVKLFSISLGYYTQECDGIEADDLIASLAKKIADAGEVAYIFSADKDFAQCVSNNVFQILPASGKNNKSISILDSNGIFEKFSVYPEQIVDYLSLIGDAADNIKGISGVGPKTAIRLLQEFGSIDNMFKNIYEITPERFRIKISEANDILKRNRSIIALNRTIDYNLPETKINRSEKDLCALLTELEMVGLLKDIRKRFDPQGLLI